MSDWYHAMPTFGTAGLGAPSAFNVLFSTVKRSNARFGRTLLSLRNSVSFRLPRITVTVAFGAGAPTPLPRQAANFGLTARSNWTWSTSEAFLTCAKAGNASVKATSVLMARKVGRFIFEMFLLNV